MLMIVVLSGEGISCLPRAVCDDASKSDDERGRLVWLVGGGQNCEKKFHKVVAAEGAAWWSALYSHQVTG
jgi:hypothetical protein